MEALVKEGNLLRVLGSLPAWIPGRTGYDRPGRLANGSLVLIVGASRERDVVFLCSEGIRSCYNNHIVECCRPR